MCVEYKADKPANNLKTSKNVPGVFTHVDCPSQFFEALKVVFLSNFNINIFYTLNDVLTTLTGLEFLYSHSIHGATVDYMGLGYTVLLPFLPWNVAFT